MYRLILDTCKTTQQEMAACGKSKTLSQKQKALQNIPECPLVKSGDECHLCLAVPQVWTDRTTCSYNSLIKRANHEIHGCIYQGLP
jgi:hypothetical protein